MNRRQAIAFAAATAATIALAGCSERGLQATDDRLQDVTEWKDPTSAPVDFSGPTVDGKSFASKDHLGEVVVVNFWYAGCDPCRAEAPDLNALAKKYTGDVQFIGVNISDDAANAAAFERTHGNVYPSILDQKGQGAAQLAFAGTRPPKAVPATLVLDRKGRVVARVVGRVDPNVLDTLIGDAVDGTAA